MPRGVFKRTPLKERMMMNVLVDETTGCWNWTAARNRQDYGQISIRDKSERAHRVSFTLHRGPIPDGQHVLHRCDNRGCINPEHLFLGTNAENMADMVSKKRQARGDDLPQTRLNELDVIAIRAAKGVTHRKLAEQFGVSETHIGLIRSGKKWSWLK